MELQRYIDIVWRRKWVLIVTLIVTIGATMAGLQLLDPVYTTLATLHIPTVAAGSPDYVDYNLQYSDRVLSTYVRMANSTLIQWQIREALSLDDLPTYEAELITNTELVEIVASNKDPLVAMQTANLVAQLLIDETENLDFGPDFAPAIVVQAEVPASPSGPNTMLFGILGVASGAVGGFVLGILFENLDPRLYHPEDIQAVTSLSVIGSVTTLFNSRRIRNMEAVQRLRLRLFGGDNDSSPEILLVTSAVRREAKTSLVVGLAKTCAGAGKSVAVVDANFCRPAIHKAFKLPNDKGLYNVLHENMPLADALCTHSSGVMILSTGPSVKNSSAIFESPEMNKVLVELGEQVDIVLIDTPAYFFNAAAAALAVHANSVIIAARCGRVTAKELATLTEQLQAINTELLGQVIVR